MRAWVSRLFSLSAAALVATACLGTPPRAQAADKAEIEAVVRKLLQEEPEIVIDAIRAYQAREQEAQASQQRQQLESQKDAIKGTPADPVIGNPNGAVTVVEFFDYRCGYCKRSLQTVLDLVDRNDDVRVVFKEFPILGEESVIAARVSLALNQVAPQHYREFHEQAMRYRGTITQDAMLDLAAKIGADRAAIENAIKDPVVDDTIRANHRLADDLGIRGTPAFIVGDRVIPGAANLTTLEKLVEDERG